MKRQQPEKQRGRQQHPKPADVFRFTGTQDTQPDGPDKDTRSDFDKERIPLRQSANLIGHFFQAVFIGRSGFRREAAVGSCERW
jgi:hypothetical protein